MTPLSESSLLENSNEIWRFGVFEVDVANVELRRSGVKVKIREQPFRVLVYLLQHSGELVSREALRQVLWPADTFVDFDHSLNTAMMKLRHALGDVSDAPVYIETIPKRGYRFIAPVTKSADPATQISSPSPAVSFLPVDGAGPARAHPPAPARPSFVQHRPPLGLLLLSLITVALGGYVLISRSSARRTNHDRTLLRTIPITSAAGDAISPVFSPDGREIAYVWDGADRKGYDLYVQLVGAELPLRLTHQTHGLIGQPAWFPDGAQIAFERCDGKNDGIFAVPALGGVERKLTSVVCVRSLPSPLAWVNANEMLFIDRCSPGKGIGLLNFSLATGDKRCISHSVAEDHGDTLALSPDGTTIAFLRTTDSLCCDIYKVPVTGGTAKRVTADGDNGCNTLMELGCSGIMWTPDGRSLVYVDDRSKLSTLLRVQADGGTPQRETTYPAIGSYTHDGLRFAYSQRISADPPAIWRAQLSAPGGALTSKSKVVSSQFPELDAQMSPDGKHIVWMSMRTGDEEIFLSDSAGNNQIQLTHLNHYSGTPRWSPDSKWIAFDSYQPGGHAEIFLIDSEGRNLHGLISAPFDCAVPSWSRDGKSIYFSANRNGEWQAWRRNLDGGTDVQLTKEGGFDPIESVDGKTVYYTRFYEPGIWKIPVDGGPETLVVPDRPQIGFWGHFAVSRTGLYFLDADAQPRPTIDFYDLPTQRISQVLTLDEHPARLQPSLSVTEDGRSIYFTQYDRQSVIKMMEFTAQ